jgi:hypothetical protein
MTDREISIAARDPVLVVGEVVLGGQLRASGIRVIELQDGEELRAYVWDALNGPALSARPVGAIVRSDACHPDAIVHVECLRDAGWELPVLITRARADAPIARVQCVAAIGFPAPLQLVFEALGRLGVTLAPAEVSGERGSGPGPATRKSGSPRSRVITPNRWPAPLRKS